MFTVKAAKSNFFDRVKIMDAVDKARLKYLAKAGFRIMQAAKWLIRTNKKPSQPGKPPHGHVGTLKNLIFFAYDQTSKNTVIGPALANKPTGAPETLEYSGETEIIEHVFKTRQGKRKLEAREKKIKIAARPYMHPALAANQAKLAEMWANSVR